MADSTPQPDKKIDFTGQDKARQEKTIADAKRKVKEAIAQRTKGLEGGLAKLIADLLPDILLGDAIEEYGRQWAAKRAEIAAQNKEELLINLANETNEFLKYIEKAGELAVKYIEVLTQSSAGGKAGPEILLKMRDSLSAKAVYLAEALANQGNKELISTIEWALGLKTDTEENRQTAFNTLAGIINKDYICECIENGSQHTPLKTPVAWVVVAFINSENRKRFTKYLIKKHDLSPKEQKAFFHAGVFTGAIPPNEIPAGIEFDKKEDQEMRIAYAMQNDFLKRGQDLIRKSYGSENDAGRMLTVKNLLLVVAIAASGVSVGGTIIANMFSQGTMKDPAKVLALLTKKSVLVGAGVGTAAYLLLNPKPGFFEGKESRETKATRETSADLYMIVNKNNGWNEFMTTDHYAGAGIMFEFTNYIKRQDELDPAKLTMDEFVYWLKLKSEGNENPEKYKAYLARIKSSKDKRYEIGGFPTTDEDLARLAKTAFVWKMGGTQTEERYTSAIRFAKGETPPPPPTT